MSRISRSVRVPAGLLGLALLAAACGSSSDKVKPEPAASLAVEDKSSAPEAAPQPQRPWTTRFLEPAALVAEVIEISGPKGLLEHVVVADAPDTSYFVKTTKDGLRQERSARSGVEFAKIVAQVDQWKLVGTKQVVVLERPGLVPVVIEARGNVYYNDDTLMLPEHGETKRFVGEIDRDTPARKQQR